MIIDLNFILKVIEFYQNLESSHDKKQKKFLFILHLVFKPAYLVK